ncbi:hypothetical protein [Nocardia seriolae]|uniref:DUF8020 domain-containing protein n=1 Tax=Nocardia seriolae TaxID=37332 RepID=A0ABC8AL64_9NOCA|nr:hypothetical protein [Nocardia seriolae]APA94901.1 hypothetical protein NS506_00822 [Nocardia seriolae]MTJ60193.1 hypothetical protein [Nocardia seriolae]MTJ72637.1 hypothetical protein [Nocardia seriolae]MTJ85188.1 hypothetical protein [Nocardia seriolae]MTK38124.1 hypothetical protein [Nocardia seriolae]
MLMRKFAVTAALVTAAVGITAGTVNAAPAATNDAAPIDYTATQTETGVTIRTDGGSMVVEDGIFKIKGADGTVLTGAPLKFQVDDFTFPIAAEISDHTATLTPQVEMDKATYTPQNVKDVALPYEDQAPWKSDYDREQAAFNRMKDTIGTGATIGTLVGGLGGAALGCIIGAGVAAGFATIGSAGILMAMFVPLLGAAGAGCIVGAGALGFVGTLAGQLFITAPVAIAAAIQYFSTINEPHIQAPAK